VVEGLVVAKAKSLPLLLWVGLWFFWVSSTTGVETPVRVEVAVTVEALEPADAPVVVEVLGLEDSEPTGEKILLELHSANQGSVSLGSGGRYRFHCPDERFWCEEQELEAVPGASVALLALRRAT
jgi:hypothetical protein